MGPNLKALILTLVIIAGIFALVAFGEESLPKHVTRFETVDAICYIYAPDPSYSMSPAISCIPKPVIPQTPAHKPTKAP